MTTQTSDKALTLAFWLGRNGILLAGALVSSMAAWWLIAWPVATLSNVASHKGHFALTFAHMAGGTGMLTLGGLNLYLAARKQHYRIHRRVGQAYLSFGTFSALIAGWLTMTPAHKAAGTPVLTNMSVSLLMLATAWDGELGRSVTIDRHPQLDDRRSCVGVDRLDEAARHDLFTHQHVRPELRRQPQDVRGISCPRGNERGKLRHREHTVGDDSWETNAPSDVVVLVQRVLVSARVGVGTDVLAGHDARERRELGTNPEIFEPSAHRASFRSTMVDRAIAATAPSPPRMVISTIRKPLSPFWRIDAIRASTVNVSPTTSGRRYS